MGEKTTVKDSNWTEFKGRQKSFSFTGTTGIKKQLPDTINPSDVFSLFVDNNVIDLILTGTNKYAEQKISTTAPIASEQMYKWEPICPNEIKTFFGLILWMDFVKKGSTKIYWSYHGLFNSDLPHMIMSQDRFKLLLSNIHFADNTAITSNDSFGKILPLLNKLQENYQKMFTPGENIIINETLIPWEGKLIFNRNISSQVTHCGMKLFKLCSLEGFTWSMMIYSGSSCNGMTNSKVINRICQRLAHKLLMQGRTLYLDNFYVSYELAISCLSKMTHVVGKVRNHELCLPKEILNANLKEGEIISKEDDNGITILTWRNYGFVRILSTKHVPLMIPEPRENMNLPYCSKKSSGNFKPIPIIDYDIKLSEIDHSEQLLSYPITEQMEWYQTLGIELLLGITVLNAFVIYKLATKRNIEIEQFKEQLIREFLNI